MTKTLRLAAFTLAITLGSPVLAQSSFIGTGDVLTADMQRYSPLDGPNAAANLLGKVVSSIEWDEITFEEILDWLRDQSDGKVNVLTKWSALEAEGVDAEAIVTLMLRGANIAEILNEALDQVSEDGQATYHATKRRIKFSSKADFDRKLELKVYEMTDILFRVPNNGQSAPSIDLTQTKSSGGGGGGGGGGQSVFQGGGSQQGSENVSEEQAEQEMEERLTKIKTLIEASIEPTSWRSTTNPTGTNTISVFNSMLVVFCTIEVHEKIGGRFYRGG